MIKKVTLLRYRHISYFKKGRREAEKGPERKQGKNGGWGDGLCELHASPGSAGYVDIRNGYQVGVVIGKRGSPEKGRREEHDTSGWTHLHDLSLIIREIHNEGKMLLSLGRVAKARK